MSTLTELRHQFKVQNAELAQMNPELAQKLREICEGLEGTHTELAGIKLRGSVDTIATVIHEWDKERCRGMMELAPISTTDRQVLAQRIFERIFKEE